jgi:hypothetical protein
MSLLDTFHGCPARGHLNKSMQIRYLAEDARVSAADPHRTTSFAVSCASRPKLLDIFLHLLEKGPDLYRVFSGPKQPTRMYSAFRVSAAQTT